MRTASDLAQMQALPLNIKVMMTKTRIREWISTYGESGCYISFSGGKDSTVLRHIVNQDWPNVPSVFVNTGLEYPEIQTFVRSCENVVMLRPEMRFDEVIKTYGYPIISKEVSNKLHDLRVAESNGKYDSYARRQFDGTYVSKNGKTNMYSVAKWKFLTEAPFKSSHMCCNVMKKKPAKTYEKETGRTPIIGTMAAESVLRRSNWLKYGCNAFDSKRQMSQPMSFWTEQDVLQYIVENNLPYASVYGEILQDENGKWYTTGVDRTGCMFCMFGCHLEKTPNRFQKMKETHPKQYEYCINQLGCGEVLDYIGVDYK